MSEQTVTLKGGIELTPEEAAEALDDAMRIIESVGTTGCPFRGPTRRAVDETLLSKLE